MIAQDLRNAILQQAIEGKLVEQRPEEGNAEDLYKQIQEEKDRLIKEGKIKQSKHLSEFDDNNKYFEIPKSWKWVRLGDLGFFKKGPFGSALTKSLFVPKLSNTIKVYEQKNAIQKDAKLGEYYIPLSYFEEKMRGFEVFPGDILVSCAGTIGETYILPNNIEKGIINQALMKIKIFAPMNKKYFILYFDTILKKKSSKLSKGSAIKNIPPLNILENYLFPLPPLKEQQRILNKIEKLMPIVDEFEKSQTKLDKLNATYKDNLKKSILQYAIQGKLVEQRPEEGNAENLYKQIQEEKDRLIKEGKIKKEKPLPEIKKDEIPFEIPKSWKWVKFGNIINYKMGKTPPRGESKYWNNDFNWISIADMSSQNIIMHTKESVSSYAINSIFANNITKKGTLIMSFKLSVGKVSILGIDAVHNEAIISIYPIIDNENEFRNYLYNILPMISKYGKKKDAIKGQTLNSKSISNLLIPLPPLGEQKRIVNKIEMIFNELGN